MGFLSSLKFCFCGIIDNMRAHKWKLLLCAVISLAGFVLGIVCFNLSGYGWWYYNRCSYASKLTAAGFSVFVSFIFVTAIIYLAYVLCNMTRYTHYLALLINLTACLYCGATLSAIFVYSAVYGVLYAVFISIVWLFIMCVACFACFCEPPICRTFCESVRDLKRTAFILAVGLIYKLFALFVILKILTALI